MTKASIIALAMMTLHPASSFAQQHNDNIFGLANRVGIGVGVGTEGIGLDVAVPLTKYVQARVGLNIMPNINFNTDVNVTVPATASAYGETYSYDIEGRTNVEAKFGRTYGDLKFDCYPFGNASSFFVTAGMSFSGSDIVKVNGKLDDKFRQDLEQGKKLGVSIGDYDIPVDENGEIHGGVKVNSVRPYLGLGFGRLIPKKRVGFRFELGAQFQGKPTVYYTENGKDVDVLEKYQKDINDDYKDKVAKVMDWLKVYPVLKLSLRGRIL